MNEDLKLETGRGSRLRRVIATSVVVAAVLSSPSLFARSDNTADGDGYGIVAVHENGRTVFVNSEEPRQRPQQERKAIQHRTSYLVFWSAREKRWKPVPPPSPSAMQAARTAANEVVTYVDSRPSLASATPLKRATANPNYVDLARGRAVSTAEVDSAIQQAALRHGVDPNLVRAIIKVESNFNPRAVSPKGAMGLMQLMPSTARGLNVTNPFDPTQNVDAGVRHFKSLMNNYGGDVRLSLAAYNAGARNVAQAGGVPRFPETQNYVKQITNMYWNEKPGVGFNTSGNPSSAPTKMFRGPDGKLVITNLD